MAEHQLTCRTCGNQFMAVSPTRGYCQQKCTPGHIAKMARKREKRSSAALKPKPDKPITHTDFVCVVCSKTFRPKHAERTKCCSRACGLELVGFTAGARKTGARVSVSVNRCRCINCGSRFTAISLACGYCSDDCRKAIANAKDRQRGECAHRLVTRVCLECATIFTPEYGNKHTTFCSDACLSRAMRRNSKQRRRAKTSGATSEAVSAIKVFDRDGWRCMICRKATPRSKRGTTNARAPELDHIVSLADGGQHTYANTQCSCRACNSKKGARSFGQLNLFPRG